MLRIPRRAHPRAPAVALTALALAACSEREGGTPLVSAAECAALGGTPVLDATDGGVPEDTCGEGSFVIGVLDPDDVGGERFICCD